MNSGKESKSRFFVNKVVAVASLTDLRRNEMFKHSTILVFSALLLLFTGRPAFAYGPAPIEDFENVSDWTVSVGSGALNGSITADTTDPQYGSSSAKLTYSLGPNVGFDYIDFAKNYATLDLSGTTALKFFAQFPNDPNMLIQLRITTLNGFLEYDFPEGSGQWEFFVIKFADMANYGTTPDLSNITQIRFRANGEVSPLTTEGQFYIDHMDTRVPLVVDETVETLPAAQNIPYHWSTSGNGSIQIQDYGQTYKQNNILQIDYSIAASQEVALNYALPSNHTEAERLRFWLKGDGSNNLINIWCYRQYAAENDWIHQAQINLDFTGWKHFEIAANSPIYHFYQSVTHIKFVINYSQNSGTNQILLSDMEFVKPVLNIDPLTASNAPTPAYDTWGSASQSEVNAVSQVGIDYHLTPIDFYGEKTVSQRIQSAQNMTPWLSTAGITPGISFYNTPSSTWISSNQDKMIKNENGDIQTTAGFTSPWNPTARQQWKTHIKNCLSSLQTAGVLSDIKILELCPADEGQVTFQWDHVWAFDDYAKPAYRNYLKQMYANDISQLNYDWETNYTSFDSINPPSDFYQDREHWVFTDFYRRSMLEYCVFLADSATEVYTPDYWLWMTHSASSRSQRFFGARYPHFYIENMLRSGCLDYTHVCSLDWQKQEDITMMQNLGAKIIGEIDIVPTKDRMELAFSQSEKFGMDGTFIGTINNLSTNGVLNDIGQTTKLLIEQ